MSNNSEKPWERPWSMEEIIENSENWNLGGDVALLNTLKSFANNLITKTNTVNDNVDNLLRNLDEVSLKLDISKNQFSSLRNTQFVENRVYEDDETVENTEEKTEEKVVANEEKEKRLINAVLNGISVMDKYYNEVEVVLSDTEDENDVKSFALAPKDLYLHRPLPHLIGSEEWYKDEHVGLKDSDSESESDKHSEEVYSDSDSEKWNTSDLDRKQDNLIKDSETSSELDFSNATVTSKPVANSTFNDSKRPDIFDSDAEYENSLPVQAPISNKNFAEQLAEKLGNVAKENILSESEINKNPIQKTIDSNKFGLFSDEPPPLDNFEDTLLSKNNQKSGGLFSGGEGLFDESDEDDSFWGQKTSKNTSVIKTDEPQKFQENIPKRSTKDIFDNSSSSDEDIFATSKKSEPKPFLPTASKNIPPLVDEEPPSLDVKKKPIGGISILGNNIDIFANAKVGNILKNRRQSSTETSDSEKSSLHEQTDKIPDLQKAETIKSPELNNKNLETQSTEILNEKPTQKPKQISLFSDADDDLFKDELFSNINSKKSNLFDDVNDNLFGNIKFPKTSNKIDLFADLDENIPEKTSKNVITDLFSDESEVMPSNSEVISRKNEIISSKSWVMPTKSEPMPTKVEQNDNESMNINEEKSNRIVESKHKKKITLFDDFEDETDDIFRSFTKSSTNPSIFDDENDLEKNLPSLNIIAATPKGKDMFENFGEVENKSKTFENEITDTVIKNPESSTEKIDFSLKSEENSNTKKSHVSLFDTIPPPDDEDEWDTKSDGFDEVEPYSYNEDTSNNQRSSIFDNEPPSLNPNESESGIGRDQNRTRIDSSVDASFSPHVSSSRRLSSDIYNEQESYDSFYVTKSKSENIAPTLNSIPEASTDNSLKYTTNFDSTFIDITPSGDPNDFEQNTSVFDKNSSSTNDIHQNNDLEVAGLGNIDKTSESRSGNISFDSPDDSSSNVPKETTENVSLFDDVDFEKDEIKSRNVITSDSSSNILKETFEKVSLFDDFDLKKDEDKSRNLGTSELKDKTISLDSPDDSCSNIPKDTFEKVSLFDDFDLKKDEDKSRNLGTSELKTKTISFDSPDDSSSNIPKEIFEKVSLFDDLDLKKVENKSRNVGTFDELFENIGDEIRSNNIDDNMDKSKKELRKRSITGEQVEKDIKNELKTAEKGSERGPSLKKKPETLKKVIVSDDLGSKDKKNQSPSDKKTSDEKDGKILSKINENLKLRMEKSKSVSNFKERLERNEETKAKSLAAKRDVASPKKLVHNLNINVNALMPGMGMPRKNIVKSVSEIQIPKKAEHEERKINFLNPEPQNSGEVEVLHSVTKDRPRIQVKRRPSTRKGRETLRKSVVDFNEENPYFEAEKNKTSDKSEENVKKDNNKKDETDKNDESSTKKTEISSNTSLLSSPESDDIFSSEKSIETVKNKNIFSDSDSDDDIFESLKKSSSKTSSSNVPVKKNIESEDDDEEAQSKKSDNLKQDKEKPFFDENNDFSFSSKKPIGSLKETSNKNKGTLVKSEEKNIFDDDESSSSDKSSKNKESLRKSEEKSIFDDDDDDDDEFSFASSSNEPTKKNDDKSVKGGKKSIFDDEDEIFSNKKKPVKQNSSNKSLFDDDDDDMDIFGSSSSKTSGKTKTDVDKKPIQKNTVKKLENTKILNDDDPLSAFLKE